MTGVNDRSDVSFTLPTKRINTKVRIRRVSRTNQGAVNNLLGGWIEYLVRKCMTTMIRDTNNVTKCFNSVRREVAIYFLVVDLLPKMEP